MRDERSLASCSNQIGLAASNVIDSDHFPPFCWQLAKSLILEGAFNARVEISDRCHLNYLGRRQTRKILTYRDRLRESVADINARIMRLWFIWTRLKKLILLGSLAGIIIVVSVPLRALAQQSGALATSSPEYPSTFTQNQLAEIWQHSFASPQELSSVADFSRTLPICLANDAIVEEKTHKILATLRLVNVLPGPMSNSTKQQQYIYLFNVKFENTSDNNLYKYWLREIQNSDHLKNSDISRIAIMSTLEIPQENNSIATRITPPLEFFLYSHLDVTEMPQKEYDNFLVLDGFGFDVGYTNVGLSSKCD